MNSGPNAIARPAVPAFGKSPIRYRDLAQWQKQMRYRLPWQKRPEAPALPSFETMLAAGYDRAPRQADWLGPLDMLLAPPIPAGTDVLAWREHSRLKDRSYQWALNELEKRASAGDLPLAAAVPVS